MRELSIDEIKEIEFKMLVDFAKYCDEKGLIYVLAGGTLLGAVRHKGFIPWDDDIDVMMPRADYIKFQEYQKEENVFVCRSVTDGSCPIPFLKIVNTETVIENKYNNRKEDAHLWVDVFPIDGLPKDERKVRSIYRNVMFMRQMLLISNAKVGKGTNVFRAVVKGVLHFPLALFGSMKIAFMIDKYCMKYEFYSSDYVGGISWGYGPQEKCPQKEWLERVLVEFEGRKFWAPGCWDLYLKNLYGEYMKLPPMEKRVQHSMKAWKM